MLQKKRILVVDDTSDIGIMLKMMLEHKGYAVTILENPEFITSVFMNNQYDLLIMDMLLSGFNGVEICRQLKKDDQTINLPVMMMSGHPDALQKCLAAGADDFMAKPFDISELLSKVNTLTTMVNT